MGPQLQHYKYLTPDEYYNRVINEGPYIPAETTGPMSIHEIPWLDPQLVKEGIEFAKEHYMAIYSAITGATLFGLAFRPITGILLRHGDISDPEFAFRRHLSGVARLQSWFDEEMYTEGGEKSEKTKEALRNVIYVRKTHALVARNAQGTPLPKLDSNAESAARKKEFIDALRADLEFVKMDPPMHLLTWDAEIPLNQFNMVATQFAGVSPVLIKSQAKILGITDMRGLAGYLHLEAVIGRMMGVRDEFNLGLHATPEFCDKFFINLVLASTKFSDETVITLQEAFVKGTTSSSIITLKGLTYSSLKSAVPNFEGKNLYKIMGVKDKLCALTMDSSAWGFTKLPFGRQLGNTLTKRYFESSVKKYVEGAREKAKVQ